jgi:hypothetical protein
LLKKIRFGPGDKKSYPFDIVSAATFLLMPRFKPDGFTVISRAAEGKVYQISGMAGMKNCCFLPSYLP